MSDKILDEDTDETDVSGNTPVEPEHSQKIEAIATMVPVHAVTTIKRRPGRPRKVNPQATATDLAYHAEISRRRSAFIDANPVVKAISGRKDSMEILQKLKEEASKEAAALHFTRIEEEKYGRDTSQISSRHLAAIREVAMLELEMKKMGSTLIDLSSERFQKIFKFFIDTVTEAAEEVLSRENSDLFMNKLETKLENWIEVAQNL